MIVPCKGRLDDLKRSLMGYLTQRGVRYRVLVVDYGCPDGAFDYCVLLRSPMLRAIKVLNDTDKYNRSRVRNCGAAHCDCPVLMFMDADVDLSFDYLSMVTRPILNGKSVCSFPSEGPGLIAVRRDVYHEVRGFDESFEGWGSEDRDFHHRVRKIGDAVELKGTPLKVRQHGDHLRTRHHGEKSVVKSNRRNLLRRRKRVVVNPSGYGEGKFRLSWRP